MSMAPYKPSEILREYLHDVAEAVGVSLATLRSSSKTANVVFARHLAAEIIARTVSQDIKASTYNKLRLCIFPSLETSETFVPVSTTIIGTLLNKDHSTFIVGRQNQDIPEVAINATIYDLFSEGRRKETFTDMTRLENGQKNNWTEQKAVAGL